MSCWIIDMGKRRAKAAGKEHAPLVLLTLLGFLFFTGCDSSSATRSQADTRRASSTPATPEVSKLRFDNCSLVSKADAESILGEAAQVSKEYGDGCEAYENVDQLSGRRVYLLIGIQGDGKQAFEEYKGMTGVLQKEENQLQLLSGIGDQAYLRGGLKGEFLGRTTLSVLKNDVWILLEVVGSPKKGSVEALKSVAKKVADAL